MIKKYFEAAPAPWLLCLLLTFSIQLIPAQNTQNPSENYLQYSKEAQPAHAVGRTQGQADPSETPRPLAPPTNDNCASAVNLTTGANCVTGTTSEATTQGGEFLCINPGGGISPETVWYRFTAANDSMVLGFTQTNSTNCATVLAVYGPFAPGAGCLPTSGNQVLCQNLGLIDPGFHPLLTGLTVGQTYLVQVQGNNCGGGGDRFSNFCIRIDQPAANNRPGLASIINNCGVAFTGTTSGGQWPNGSSVGANNLDNNNATSVAGASETGDDVLFVINNVSWFTFCNGNAGACNWSITLNGVSGCLLPSPNDGVQAALFTGTPGALVNVASSPSRIPTGGSWATGTFSVPASGCAYIMVDGFAGDACNYNLTLTNVSCPCALLPIELAYLNGFSMPDRVQLRWHMNAEEGVSRYQVSRSTDGLHYTPLTQEVPVNPVSGYSLEDLTASPGWNFYQLRSIDVNGEQQHLSTVSIFHGGGMPQPLLSYTPQGIGWLLPDASPSPTQLGIYDLQGRQVHASIAQAPGPGQAIDIPLQGLAPGVYLLRSTNAAGHWTQRFVIP